MDDTASWHWKHILPLLLLSSRSHPDRPYSPSSSSATTADTFAEYLEELVGRPVRVSVVDSVDNAATLVGILHRVGSDFLVLRDVSATGILLNLCDQLAIPLSNIAGINQQILPIILPPKTSPKSDLPNPEPAG